MLSHGTRSLPHARAHEPTRLVALIVLSSALAACTELPSTVEEAAVDACQSLGPITLGQSNSESLAEGDCPTPAGGFSDRWTLTLSGETHVRIDLVSSAFDPFLEIHDASGNVIASNDDTGSLNSRIIHTLSPGSYIVLVRAFASHGLGGYTLSVVEGPDCSPLGTVAIGAPVTGTLGSTDCRSDWDAPMDNWSITSSSPQRLRVDLTGPQFDEVLLMRSPEGWVFASSDWNHPSGHARLDTEIPAGTWTVSVTTSINAGGGAYDLSVGAAPPCSPGTRLVLGQTESGTLAPDDCLLAGGMPADSFSISLAEDTDISIHLKSSAFAPFVVLRDPQGVDVAIGYDDMGDGNARLRTALAPGVYAIMVTGAPPAGDYTLTVDEVVCEAPQPIALGTAVSGSLDAMDCTRPGGAFREAWELVLTADTTLRIDLTSNGFDPYLIVKNENGGIVSQDDDGGDGLNARVQTRLSAGTYVIEASAFNAGSTGAYTLSVVASTPTPIGARPVVHDAPTKPTAVPETAARDALRSAMRSLVPTIPPFRSPEASLTKR